MLKIIYSSDVRQALTVLPLYNVGNGNTDFVTATNPPHFSR